MPANSTTDNFFPARGQSYYTPRPIPPSPRRAPAPLLPSRQPLISDFLPPTAPIAQPKRPPKRLWIYALPLTLLFVVAGNLVSLQPAYPPAVQPSSLQAAAVGKFKASPQPAPASIGLPQRLKIPKLNIDAPLDYVGLTASGDLDASKDPDNAGWYDQGPRPGEAGSAVIDGHFGWHDGIPAVFDNLHKLQAGDKVYVVDKNGATTAFVVRELQTFGQDEEVPQVFGSSDKNETHLNLITCQGTWNNTQKSYSNRLVVFTDKVKT